MRFSLTLIGALLLLNPILLFADSLDVPRKIKILPVPTFGYSPETKAYAGVVALATIDQFRDSLTRVSNAKIELSYTRNRQFIAEAGWNYFSKGEKWFTQGLVHASRYPDLYYGIGYTGNGDHPVRFESTRIKTDIHFLKSLKKSWFVGPHLRFARYGHISGDAVAKFSELKEGSYFGGGMTLLKDQRDNLLNARKGHFLMLTTSTQFSHLSNYTKITIDGRIYRTLPKWFTMATRIYQQVNTSEPVFFDQAVAGGDAFVRGYFYGLYRNRQLGFIQTEWRSFPVRRIGLAIFGGYSVLFNQKFEPQATNLYNYGAGLRILVDKQQNINLRIEYARGVYGQSGFYIAFGEAF